MRQALASVQGVVIGEMGEFREEIEAEMGMAAAGPTAAATSTTTTTTTYYSLILTTTHYYSLLLTTRCRGGLADYYLITTTY